MQSAVNVAGQVAAGKWFSHAESPFLSVFGGLADTAVYYGKSERCRAAADITRVQLPECGATFLYYYTFPFSLIAGFAGDADMNNKLSVGQLAGDGADLGHQLVAGGERLRQADERGRVHGVDHPGCGPEAARQFGHLVLRQAAARAEDEGPLAPPAVNLVSTGPVRGSRS